MKNDCVCKTKRELNIFQNIKKLKTLRHFGNIFINTKINILYNFKTENVMLNRNKLIEID